MRGPTLCDARLMILDEPTAALGVAQAAQVRELITNLRAESLGVVVVSHNIDDVFEAADRIGVLYIGRNMAAFERAATSKEEVVSAILGVLPVGPDSRNGMALILGEEARYDRPR